MSSARIKSQTEDIKQMKLKTLLSKSNVVSSDNLRIPLDSTSYLN